MKGACPLKTNPDWVASQDILGEDNTWELWMVSNTGTVPEPVAGAFYFYTKENVKKATALLEKYIPAITKAQFPADTTILDMIDSAQEAIFQDPDFKGWLAKNNYFESIYDKGKIKRTQEQEEAAEKKIQTLEELAKEVPDMSSYEYAIDPVELQNKIRTAEILQQFGKMLSVTQDSKYSIITEADAKKLLANSSAPYSGEAIFIQDGTIYYVKDKINLNTDFADMALPVLELLRKNKRKEFDNMYDRLTELPEGQMLVEKVAEKYPKIVNQESDLFKQKVLIEALKLDAENRRLNASGAFNNSGISEPFTKYIQSKLMGSMRTAIKLKMGKIKAENISTNTNLNTVADIFKSPDFKVETESISSDEMKNYANELQTAAKELLAAVARDPNKKKIDERLQTFLDEFLRKNRTQSREVGTRRGFKNIAKELSDPEHGGFLKQMADQLKYFRKDVSPEMLESYEKMSETFKAQSLVNALFTLEKTLMKINEYLDKVVGSEDSVIDKLTEVENYDALLKDWLGFIDNAKKQLLSIGLPRTSFLYGFVSNLDVLVNDGRSTIKQIQEEGAVQETTGMLKSFTSKITKQIDAEIERVNKIEGDPKIKEKRLKQLREDREKYNLNEERVRDLYKGNLGDSNWWSNMFISYTSDPDPIVATFALYLKKHMSQITARAYSKASNFAKEIADPMAKLGMTNVNYDKDWVGNGFLSVDTKAGYDEEGNIVPEQVMSITSAFKNWRYDKALMDKKIEDAKKTGDKKLIKKAYEEKENMEKVFNREYSPEFYQAREKLRKENIEAYDALENINAEIEMFKQENSNDYDFFQNYDGLTALLNKRERLYSMYDENNVVKSDADKAIAQALLDHRKRTSKFYESKPKPGAFQRAADAFVQMITTHPEHADKDLFDSDGRMTGEMLQIFDQWLAQNTVLRHTQLYYDLTASIYKRLAEISKDLPADYNISEEYAKKTSLLLGYKDNNGQFNPDLIKPEKRDKIMKELKEIDEKIDKIITKQKAESATRDFSEKEAIAMQKMKEVISELNRIRYKKPSEYYLETLNSHLSMIGAPGKDFDTADELLRPANKQLLNTYFEKSDEFKEWFEKNHIKSSYVNNKGELTFKYKRLDAWNIGEPIEDEGGAQYTQSTQVIINGHSMTVPGVPVAKYNYYRIKDFYIDEQTGKKVQIRTIPFGLTEEERNERYVGKVIDNKGNYLPLSKERAAELGVSTSYTTAEGETKSYINEDYYNIISNPDKKKLLDIVTKYTLANQVGTERANKLFLDLPRLPVNQMLEGVQRGTIKQKWVDRLKGIKAGVGATISGMSNAEANKLSQQAGDVEEGFANAELEQEREEFVMAKDGIIDPLMDKIPVKGLSKMPLNQISHDVIGVLNFYMLQLEREKVLKEINPVAKAMLKTLENTDEGVEQLKKIREKNFGATDVLKAFMGKKVGTKSRTAAIRALYNREVLGQVNSEKHLDWLNKVTSTITGAASMNYFALNLPSAIKNYWGILWQLNVEAAAGEHMDKWSLGKAKGRSHVAMIDWSNSIWGGKYNSVNSQMIIMFDPAQGKTEEVIGKDFSRTFARDLASLSWTYSPRKYMEMQGAIQLFFSMAYYKKVDQTINGVTRKIPYADAFELKEGKLVLKEGIDAELGITYDQKGNPTLGAEFVKFQNLVHEKFKDLNGTFAKFEQPQAQQYFAYRLFAFMRRYFTSMFMNRFGKRRANFAIEEVRTGYYVEAIQAVAKTIISLGREIPYMSASEKRAMIKTLADIGQIFIVSMMAVLLFGYDDDDEDRFEKLRAKSGALGDEDFHLDGWLSNHALTLLLKTQAENQSFIPLPGLGLNNYLDLTSSTSLAFGPTITSWAKLLTDLSMHALPGENEDLFYKRDTGPYEWQKEGSAKIWNHLSSMLGFSGSQVDPIKGLQSFETFSRQ